MVVTDGQTIFAIFLNVGAPVVDLLNTKITIGKFNYLANYFVNALDLLHSKTLPRVLWSFMDTSESVDSHFFGFEIELFKDYFFQIDLRKLDGISDSSKTLKCKIKIAKSDSKSPQEFELPFVVNYTENSVALKVADGNLTSTNKTFTLSMLESVSSLNLKEQFTG